MERGRSPTGRCRWAKPFTPRTAAIAPWRSPPTAAPSRIVAGNRAVYLLGRQRPARPVSHGSPLTLRTRFMGPDAQAFSPDGRILATAYDDHTVQLWNVSDPSHVVPLGTPLTGHKGYVHALVFSPDGRTLASGSADGTVRLWNVTDPAAVAARLDAPLTGHRGRGQRPRLQPGRQDAGQRRRRRHGPAVERLRSPARRPGWAPRSPATPRRSCR